MSDRGFDSFRRLSLGDQYVVDRACTRFERELRAGGSPAIEDFLRGHVTLVRLELLRELLAAEVEYRRARGEPVPDEAYLSRFADSARVVRDVLGLPAPPPAVPGYDVYEEIGRGGMGVVYRGRHLGLGRPVALKMLLGGGFVGRDHLARFLVEGETLARLVHPHIVAVYDVGECDGLPFLALEYVPGGTLADRVKAGPLPPAAAARVVEVLAGAVHHAHRNGVVHRDLKPANVLLAAGPDGDDALPDRARIADFGLARRDAEGATGSGHAVGTPGYMPPEQARGDPHTGPAADVYGLGAVLYTLLTGGAPFRESTAAATVRAVLEADPRRPTAVRPDVPRDLETICLKCLEKEPARRYPGADALADDLRRWRTGEPITARPVGTAERAVKWARRRKALAAALAVAALLAVALVGVAVAAGASLRAERNALLAEQRRTQDADRRRVAARAEAVLTAAPESLPYLLETLAPDAADALPVLRERFDDPAAPPGVRLRAAVALTAFGEPRVGYVLDAAPDARAAEGPNLALAVRAARSPAVAADLLTRSRCALRLSARSRYAILLLDLGDDRGARGLLDGGPDPTPRAVFADEFRVWHGDLHALPALLRAGTDPDVRSGLVVAAGGIDPMSLRPADRAAIATAFRDLFVASPDGGTHSAADWALRRWGHPPPSIPGVEVPNPGAGWFVNRTGMTMVRLAAGGGSVGGMTVGVLPRPVYVGDREVSVEVFSRFAAAVAAGADPHGPLDWHGPTPESPEPLCPVNQVSRRDAVRFCNWLSDREGRRPCYTPTEVPDQWACDFAADGYRLPTEAEWETVGRAGAASRYFFGDDPTYLRDYAHVASSRTAPGGTYRPNRWGVFDITGNLWEMCWDHWPELYREVRPDPPPAQPAPPWVSRGGAYDSGSYDTGMKWRFGRHHEPSNSFGFRVVCASPGEEPDPTARQTAIRRALEQLPSKQWLRDLAAGEEPPPAP